MPKEASVRRKKPSSKYEEPRGLSSNHPLEKKRASQRTGGNPSRDPSKSRSTSTAPDTSNEKKADRKTKKKRDPSRHRSTKKDPTPSRKEEIAMKEDAPIGAPPQEPRMEESPEPEYENDFEEYEEDFESEESDGEEGEEDMILIDSKMDSGLYDVRILKEIAEVKSALYEENNSKINLGAASKPLVMENVKNDGEEKDGRHPQVSVFNFKAAKQRNQEMETSSKVKKRGRQLLSMIRLDTVSMDILNFPSYSYEKFMSAFGRGRQAVCQTGHDDGDKEVQCEGIETSDKWTQFPPPIQFDASITPIHEIIRGSGEGGDQIELLRSSESSSSLGRNHPRLEEFIRFGGNLILTLLEEKNSRFLALDSPQISDGLESISNHRTSLTLLPCMKYLSSLMFAHQQPYNLFTCHYDAGSSYISSWNLNAPAQSPPLRILHVKGIVSKFCLTNHKTPFVIAGLTSGVIALWDLREDSGWQNESSQYPTRSPTYIDDHSHGSPLLTIYSLPDSMEYSQSIISIEESSKVIIWTVLEEEWDESLGLAHWGTVKLLPSRSFLLEERLIFRDICGDKKGKKLFLAGNDGGIHSFSRRDFRVSFPSIYKPQEDEGISYSNCNLVDYADSRELLFGGYDDGIIRVYILNQSRPIREFPSWGKGVSHPLLEMRISPHRRPLIFILNSDSEILSWSLQEGLLYPISSVHVRGAVSLDVNMQTEELGAVASLLALGRGDGQVDIHTLREEFPIDNNTDTLELF